MKLRDYLSKYKITIVEFAKRTDMSLCAYSCYLNGTRRPSLKTARIIERETDGLVTIAELRGKEKPRKKKK